jgi:hypothetical protein
MNMCVRQQILMLRECFYNASHWVRQRIPVLRDHFHNASRIDQLCWVTALLFTLSLPIYLFIPTSRMGEIIAWIFFSTWIVDHLWRNRYPAFKRWITEKEYSRQAMALYERLAHV